MQQIYLPTVPSLGEGFPEGALTPEDVWGKKSFHTLAALGFIANVLGVELSPEVVNAIQLLELTQVDFPDSISEMYLRESPDMQEKLFWGLKIHALYGIELPLFDLSHVWEVQDKKALQAWEAYLHKLCGDLHHLLHRNHTWATALPLIDSQITNYYHFIGAAHTQAFNGHADTNQLRHDLIRATFRQRSAPRSKPDWVKSEELWLMFFGESISFLSALALSCEKAEDFSAEMIRQLFMAYRTIGILNVILDDFVDIEEDITNHDPNVILAVEEGKYTDDIQAVATQFNIDTTNKSQIEILLEGVVLQCKQDLESLLENPILRGFANILPSMLKLYSGLMTRRGVKSEYITPVERLLEQLQRTAHVLET